MESVMAGAVVVETALLSILMALWISWLGLRGLFQLMPGTNRTPETARVGNTQENRSGVARETDAQMLVNHS